MNFLKNHFWSQTLHFSLGNTNSFFLPIFEENFGKFELRVELFSFKLEFYLFENRNFHLNSLLLLNHQCNNNHFYSNRELWLLPLQQHITHMYTLTFKCHIKRRRKKNWKFISHFHEFFKKQLFNIDALFFITKYRSTCFTSIKRNFSKISITTRFASILFSTLLNHNSHFD